MTRNNKYFNLLKKLIVKIKDIIKTDKDIWDILDTIGKLLSAIVLGFLTIVIGVSSDKIATSIKKGELVQRLITDLAAQDTTIKRQDIALITLDSSLGDEDPNLIIEISERIYKDLESKDTDARVAFEIIRKHDSDLARNLLNESFTKIELWRKESLRNSEMQQILEEKIASESTFIQQVFPHVVYIQVGDETQQKLGNKLVDYLKNYGLNTPPIEVIPNEFKRGVRFFDRKDELLAKRVTRLVNEFLQNEQKTNLLNTEFVKGYDAPAQIEIWID